MPGRAITQHCPQCQMPLVLPETFLGRTVACSRCGQNMLVEDNPAPAAPLPPHLVGKVATPVEPHSPPAVPSPIPPHLQTASRWAGAPEPVASVIPLEPLSEKTPARAPRRSCLASVLLLIMALVTLLSAVVGVVLLAGWIVRQQQNANSESAEGDPSGKPRRVVIDKREYTNASRKSVARSGMLVRVDDVAVGKVHYRSKGEIMETATSDYLMITLNVKNKSRTEPVEYQSWYSYEFEDEEEGPQRVELIDDDGGELELFPIPGADNVERHIRSDFSLPLDDDVYDTLVFKLPDDYLDNPVPPLYLKLPAAAIGDKGHFRFHIPGTMIERRD